MHWTIDVGNLKIQIHFQRGNSWAMVQTWNGYTITLSIPEFIQALEMAAKEMRNDARKV